MFSAFKNRRPWAVAIINLAFGPFIGMLYLNRGYLALIYLVLEYAGIAALVVFLKPVTFFAQVFTIIGLSAVFLHIVGTIQGVLIARQRNQNESIRWYAHWYAIVAVCLFSGRCRLE